MDEVLRLQAELRVKSDEARNLLRDEKGDTRRNVSDHDLQNADILVKQCETIRRKIDKFLEDEARLSTVDGLTTYLDSPDPSQQAIPIQPTAEPRSMPDHDVSTFPPSEWRDLRTGESVHVLDKRHRLVDLPSKSPVHPSELSLGRSIVASITGDWSNAKAELRALGGNVNTVGGYLVPDELSMNVIDLARAESVLMRAGAQTVPMTSDFLAIARIAADPTFEQKDENATFSGSDINFDRVQLTSRTIGQVIYVSNELLADAVNMAQVIDTTLARAFATELDRLAIRGTSGEGLDGLSNKAGIQTTAIGGALDWDKVLDAYEDILDKNTVPTGMITTPAISIALSKLKIASEANHYLTGPPGEAAQLARFTTNQAASGEAYVANFATVLFGIRLAPTIQISTHEKFSDNKTSIRLVWRGDVVLEHSDWIVSLTGITT